MRHIKSVFCIPLFLFSSLMFIPDSTSAQISNWPQFRGPDGTGVVNGETNVPDTWSLTENVEWQQEIPGRGWSSPVVWDNQVFFTTVVNTGESEAPKKGLYFGGERPKPESVHQWFAYCLDVASGNEIWKKQIHEGPPETSIHIKNSFASETPVTDGEHVYFLFGGLGVYCFDLEGNEIWKQAFKPRKTRYGWGYAASPVLHGDRLYIVNDNEEESYLLALDKKTGDEIWRVSREEKSNWSTPFVWENEQRTEIVTAGSGKVRSYDLEGNLLWSLKGMSSITIAVPYESNGLLYVTSGYVGDGLRPIYAIRPGASGDISSTDGVTANAAIAWSNATAAPYNPSTIVYDGILYVLHDRGMLASFDAATGEEFYSKKRIRNGRSFTSSPWAYDGNIFCLNEDGTTFVFKAGKVFEQLHTNQLAEGDMGMATPAIVGDRLLIRSAKHIYSIKKSP